jgi:hypothetical protein
MMLALYLQSPHKVRLRIRMRRLIAEETEEAAEEEVEVGFGATSLVTSETLQRHH